MNAPQPIETEYRGYRFRSRLEARWAVFFTEAKIPFQYEPEGYDLGEFGWYLPDFWLPAPFDIFVECKAADVAPLTLFHNCWLIGILSEVRNETISAEFVRYLKGYWPEPKEQSLARALARLKGAPARVAVVYGDPLDARNCDASLIFSADGQCNPWCYELKRAFEDHPFEDAARAARQARFEHGENGRPSRGASKELRDAAQRLAGNDQ